MLYSLVGVNLFRAHFPFLVGTDEMAAVLAQNETLFAGDILTDEQKDMFYEAVSRAYFANKKRARDRFGKRSPKKQME